MTMPRGGRRRRVFGQWSRPSATVGRRRKPARQQAGEPERVATA